MLSNERRDFLCNLLDSATNEIQAAWQAEKVFDQIIHELETGQPSHEVPDMISKYEKLRRALSKKRLQAAEKALNHSLELGFISSR